MVNVKEEFKKLIKPSPLQIVINLGLILMFIAFASMAGDLLLSMIKPLIELGFLTDKDVYGFGDLIRSIIAPLSLWDLLEKHEFLVVFFIPFILPPLLFIPLIFQNPSFPLSTSKLLFLWASIFAYFFLVSVVLNKIIMWVWDNKNRTRALMVVILIIIIYAFVMWQLIISQSNVGTDTHGNPCGGYYGFGKVKPMEPSLQLLYDGTFSVSLMNGLGMPMKLTHLEVRYEGERHDEDVEGRECIIQQPVTGTEFDAGRVFQVIAHCPNINKEAERASIYLTFEYEYTIENNDVSATELGNLCLLNNGDKFS